MSTNKSKKMIVKKINDRFRISYGNVDLSSKNKIAIIPPQQEYEDQTMLQLQDYNRQVAEVKKQFYSSNAAIERIMSRTFADIVKAVWINELRKPSYKKKNTKHNNHAVNVQIKK